MERRQTTSRDGSNVSSKQRVAGSNPAGRARRSSRFCGGLVHVWALVIVAARSGIVLVWLCVPGCCRSVCWLAGFPGSGVGSLVLCAGGLAVLAESADGKGRLLRCLQPFRDRVNHSRRDSE